ncbi:hypothetical protein J3Q64DRAFT_1752347 [Phycomyces blakesleeanus]|uniref:Thioredoxin-like fold domain-containing protein n=1 Tax=Phycomyces blakesleeanus TaxID=4837 RepID=A0ABR3AUX1_PHYBL
MSFRPPKTLPILSIFHNPSSNASQNALRLLQAKQKRPSGEDVYRVDVQDNLQEPLTSIQLKQIAEYLGGGKPDWKPMISTTSTTATENQSFDYDAQQLLHDQPSVLQRPLVVDWNQGKAAVGPALDKIQQLIESRLKL